MASGDFALHVDVGWCIFTFQASGTATLSLIPFLVAVFGFELDGGRYGYAADSFIVILFYFYSILNVFRTRSRSPTRNAEKHEKHEKEKDEKKDKERRRRSSSSSSSGSSRYKYDMNV